MDLHHTSYKAFSLLAFLGLALAPVDGTRRASNVSSPHVATTANATSTANAASTANATRAKAASTGAPVATTPTASACPEGMLLVEGDYCPEAEQVCLRWMDPPPYQNLRCGEYAKPASCKGQRTHKKFCIDADEYAERSETSSIDKDALPLVKKNWNEAKALCESRGARLCKETEWEFACEGPEMRPYPYGWKREAMTCNHDRTDLGGPNEKLTDHRAALSAFPECVSAFGVHNMVGNVDEWVERENASAPNRSSLRGGWWLPGRNRCRAATIHHDESYSGKQVGFRCCKDTP